MPPGFAGPRSSMPATRAPCAGLIDEALGDVVGDLLDAHAEPAAPRLAELAELIDDGDRGVRRHRKADADRAAGRRDDRGVDADDVAVEVEQRAAGIAAIDGGVGLNVIVVRARIDVAVARRNDAGSHRAAEAERVADRDHPFAEPQLVAVAELDRLKRLVGMDAQQGQIALGVLADQLGRKLGAVVEDDVDLVGIGDHVVVGDDDAGRVDDEAGSERVDAPRRVIRSPWSALAAAVLEEFLEELLHRRTRRQIGHVAELRVHLLRRRNVDHRIDHLFGDVGDIFRSPRRGSPCRQNDDRRGNRGDGRALAHEPGEMAKHGRSVLLKD